MNARLHRSVALGVLGTLGLWSWGCADSESADSERIAELQKQVDDLNARVAACDEGLRKCNDDFAALRKHRTNVLTLSFAPSTLKLAPVPLVDAGSGQSLDVVVDFRTNPDNWRKVVVHDCTDVTGNALPTTPARLDLDSVTPTGSLKLGTAPTAPMLVECSITYDRPAGKMTIEAIWERWP